MAPDPSPISAILDIVQAPDNTCPKSQRGSRWPFCRGFSLQFPRTYIFSRTLRFNQFNLGPRPIATSAFSQAWRPRIRRPQPGVVSLCCPWWGQSEERGTSVPLVSALEISLFHSVFFHSFHECPLDRKRTSVHFLGRCPSLYVINFVGADNSEEVLALSVNINQFENNNDDQILFSLRLNNDDVKIRTWERESQTLAMAVEVKLRKLS